MVNGTYVFTEWNGIQMVLLIKSEHQLYTSTGVGVKGFRVEGLGYSRVYG